MKPAIVVIGFNRPESLRRLLHSLTKAVYETGDIPLVISVDGGGSAENEQVRQAAEEYVWGHGEKRLLFRDENMGLKRHVLSCGELSREYGSALLLEDDLYASPCFYSFGCEALAFCEGRELIGGVSLYNHLFNVHAREPFEALSDGYDNWYFQFASSWGQGFTAAQWDGFASWLSANGGKWPRDLEIPANVAGWSNKSWLKDYVAYLVSAGKYFLYPRVSLTTNFFDEGTHSRRVQNDFQVPLQRARSGPYRFSPPEESGSVYDAFFENEKLGESLSIPKGELTADLYGYRPCRARYYLTSRALPYKIIESYGLKLRPMDLNILERFPGGEFFLYDTTEPGKTPEKEAGQRILYHNRGFKAKYIKEIIKTRIRERL